LVNPELKRSNDALIFSPSGIRGIFNKSFTLHDAINFSVAFAETLREGGIVVGRDTRPSGEPITNAVVAGLNSVGRDVFDVEVAPTPTILHAVRDLKAAGGIIISASHNPPEWNALKLAGPDGILLGGDAYKQIQKKVKEGSYGGTPSRFGFRRFCNPFRRYFESIINYIDDRKLKSRLLKVAVDAGGGAGALVTPRLLRKLGCKVRTIHCCIDGFFPRPLEPTQESLNDLSRFVVSTGSDVGFAHDCDADRMVCVSEDGSVLRPDEGFAIIIDGILRENPGGLIVTNVASSMLVEDVAERYDAKVLRVAVGEVNVVKAMMKHKAKVGGEGSSGGVIIPEVHYVRDGPLACAKMVEILAETGMSVSEILNEYSRYYLKRVKLSYPQNLSEKIIREIVSRHRDEDLDLTDGVKLCRGKEWILVRPSRTEPKIRVWAEARSPERAEQLCKSMVDEVKSIILELRNNG